MLHFNNPERWEMVIKNPIELRSLKNRQWKRPEDGLRELQVAGFLHRMIAQRGDLVSWRKRRFKKYLEEHQAALFAYGLQQQSPDYNWEYSYGEGPASKEHDCFLKCEVESQTPLIKPVQLKEFVPPDVNARSSLQGLINKVSRRYSAVPGKAALVVAIFVNRPTTIKFEELRIPAMGIEQLWLYGFRNSGTCFLTGNLLGRCKTYSFEYPRMQATSFRLFSKMSAENARTELRIEKPAALAALEDQWESSAHRHTCLLCWNRGKTPVDHVVNNGSCCFLQTRQQRILVTCAHVWRGYEDFRERRNDARLWISLLANDRPFAPSLPFPLSNPKLFSIDDGLDLATIVFDEIDILDAWRFYKFRGGGAPKVRKDDPIHFLGFAGRGVRAGNPTRSLNYFYSMRTVHDITPYRFILHDEPGTTHHENSRGKKTRPVRITGVSGAPVFRIRPNLNLELAGIVREVHSSGLRGNLAKQYKQGDGDVHVAHACFIQTDGTITSPNR